MTMIDVPAQPDEGPATLPTPEVDQPAQPGEGPVELPTPSLPSQPQVTIPIRLCPLGYQSAIVQNGQTFTDLLLQHNVSWQAMRAANPTLPTTRLAPGTRYCVPPQQTRRLCPSGSSSYVMGQFEDLSTLSELFSLPPGLFLTVNPQLAPGDFTAGRVVCIP
ncbi:MAG: LysM peptidoglycan-binding domain-containing protein [Clostridia bacterium]|nr:LysM peptidoglycan-binding domain-containing protein [Clostridia bacterium]